MGSSGVLAPPRLAPHFCPSSRKSCAGKRSYGASSTSSAHEHPQALTRSDWRAGTLSSRRGRQGPAASLENLPAAATARARCARCPTRSNLRTPAGRYILSHRLASGPAARPNRSLKQVILNAEAAPGAFPGAASAGPALVADGVVDCTAVPRGAVRSRRLDAYAFAPHQRHQPSPVAVSKGPTLSKVTAS